MRAQRELVRVTLHVLWRVRLKHSLLRLAVSCARLASDVGAHGADPPGTLLLLPKPSSWLWREATALQRHRQAHPAAADASRYDQAGRAQVPVGPGGSWEESGVAQDYPCRGSEDIGMLPEGQAPLGLARGVSRCVEGVVPFFAR